MMKEKTITRTLHKKGKTRLGKTDLMRLDAMTEAEIEANALLDEDNPPLTKQDLAGFKRVNAVNNADIKAI